MNKNIQEYYDIFSEEYARLFYDELDNKPFDRSILLHFSELTKGKGTVGDIGCGIGHIGHFLYRHGVNVVGIDLSDEMIKQAKGLFPDMNFEQGNMFSLRFHNEYLAGIVSFYSIVHFSSQKVERALHEFQRVIKSGGHLLIAFHVLEESIQVKKSNGDNTISVNFPVLHLDTVLEMIERNGFCVEEAILRYPYKDVEYPSKRAYILARKIL